MPKSRAQLQLIESPPAVRVRRGAPAQATQRIVESITTAIVERRLMPGTKLAEQKIADIFGVSRTLVRQALNQLSRDRLVTLEPARGAVVASPSVDEARQVFEVRAHARSGDDARSCARAITPAQIAAAARAPAAPSAPRSHAPTSRAARGCWPTSTSCWRACWATRCWPQLLGDLLSRSSLIALMYQSVALGRDTRTTSTWPSSTRWSAATRAPRCA